MKEDFKRPVCPNCNKEMKRVLFVGYYDEFQYWDCECDDYKCPDEKWKGAYA